ncbi:MAG: hypothetical protein L0229_28770 [Blastocatellia bacterium]|nr:hypothetical protein [Blastocatellia bacterium]
MILPPITARVEAAERELLAALREAIPAAEIYRDRATGSISALVCDFYIAAERLTGLAK